jgi:[acyl-carrier-protein] S-malonyltransferase
MNASAENTDTGLAIVFPGQGSQSVGMLSELAAHYPQVNETFGEASDILGYDLWQLVSDGPAEELNQTDRTQPAMLAAGVAVWRVWQGNNGPVPAVMAGHSLGEYTALVCAGSIAFADAVALVAERGRCMQRAVPEGSGAMAAILGLDDATVMDVCNTAAEGSVVSAVNFNSPGQVVIAGETGAVERATRLAKERGAKRAVQLPVSVPSHCDLMRTAAGQFAGNLGETTIVSPEIPVLHNVDVKAHDDPASIRELLAQQLYSPVQWVKTIEAMRDRGVTRMVEAGPGKVLSGLAKRIDRALTAQPVFDPGSLAAALMNE